MPGSRNDGSIEELRAEVTRTATRLDALARGLQEARKTSVAQLGRTNDAALIVAGYLETYYTALETLFVRASAHFENNLNPQQWHADLLEKMNLSIPELRERLVSDENLPRLRELMRFRHFRRYFVEMEYDWLRIDFLLNCLEAAHPVVLRDLDRFDEFLLALASA